MVNVLTLAVALEGPPQLRQQLTVAFDQWRLLCPPRLNISVIVRGTRQRLSLPIKRLCRAAFAEWALGKAFAECWRALCRVLGRLAKSHNPVVSCTPNKII